MSEQARRHLKARQTGKERSEMLRPPDRHRFIRLCALFAIGSCAASVGLILTGDFVVTGNDMIADTISAMAAGSNMWLAEMGIYAFSFALLLIGLGCAAAHPGGWWWSGSTLGFVALGIIVFLIGFRDEYGDGDRMASETVHIELVYAFAGLMAVTTVMAWRGLTALDSRLARYLGVSACAWTVLAPIFAFMPTGYDGIYERFLGAIAVLIVLLMGKALLTLGRTGAETS